MKIVISPAKKMNESTDLFRAEQLPVYLERTKQLLKCLRAMDGQQLQKMWKCNDSIAAQNIDRLQNMELSGAMTPAILAYEGIQYRYMAPSVLSSEGLNYIREHLRILSGFYGVVRPFDGVCPYRLEMQAGFSPEGSKDLYAFWGDLLYREVRDREDGLILNLASREYSRCIEEYLKPEDRMITCVFGEEHGGKIIEKGTYCKMARGEMVRFLAENGFRTPQEIKKFDGIHYFYSQEHSSPDRYVFLMKKKFN